MNIYSLSILLFSFGVLLVAVLTLAKRKDYVAIRFLIFSIVVCGWGFPEALWFSQQYSREVSLILTRISHAFAVWIPITWFHFVLEFVGRKEPTKYFYRLNYSIVFFLTLLCPTSLFVSGMHNILHFKYYSSPGPFYHFFTTAFFTLVPFGFFYLIRAHKSRHGQFRGQLKYFILATIIGFIAGSTTFLPVYKIPFPLFLLPAMVLYPFLMGVALIRYGLFDPQQIADAFQREKLAAIGTMAASLNHELRNPLFVAKGKIESHLDAVGRGLYTSLDERADRSDNVLATALNHLTRAMDIMQRFSDFAKPFGGRSDKETVVLKETLQDVLLLVSNEFEIKKIKVLQSINSECISANRRQLEEVFFNLIINACQAMNGHGGELSLEVSQPNGKVVIEISDTGPGVPKENLNRIFEPFYTTKAEKGSGLGLYITKQLVERNGGKISVKSKLGQGTSFILEFKRQGPLG